MSYRQLYPSALSLAFFFLAVLLLFSPAALLFSLFLSSTATGSAHAATLLSITSVTPASRSVLSKDHFDAKNRVFILVFNTDVHFKNKLDHSSWTSLASMDSATLWSWFTDNTATYYHGSITSVGKLQYPVFLSTDLGIVVNPLRARKRDSMSFELDFDTTTFLDSTHVSLYIMGNKILAADGTPLSALGFVTPATYSVSSSISPYGCQPFESPPIVPDSTESVQYEAHMLQQSTMNCTVGTSGLNQCELSLHMSWRAGHNDAGYTLKVATVLTGQGHVEYALEEPYTVSITSDAPLVTVNTVKDSKKYKPRKEVVSENVFPVPLLVQQREDSTRSEFEHWYKLATLFIGEIVMFAITLIDSLEDIDNGTFETGLFQFFNTTEGGFVPNNMILFTFERGTGHWFKTTPMSVGFICRICVKRRRHCTYCEWSLHKLEIDHVNLLTRYSMIAAQVQDRHVIALSSSAGIAVARLTWANDVLTWSDHIGDAAQYKWSDKVDTIRADLSRKPLSTYSIFLQESNATHSYRDWMGIHNQLVGDKCGQAFPTFEAFNNQPGQCDAIHGACSGANVLDPSLPLPFPAEKEIRNATLENDGTNDIIKLYYNPEYSISVKVPLSNVRFREPRVHIHNSNVQLSNDPDSTLRMHGKFTLYNSGSFISRTSVSVECASSNIIIEMAPNGNTPLSIAPQESINFDFTVTSRVTLDSATSTLNCAVKALTDTRELWSTDGKNEQKSFSLQQWYGRFVDPCTVQFPRATLRLNDPPALFKPFSSLNGNLNVSLAYSDIVVVSSTLYNNGDSEGTYNIKMQCQDAEVEPFELVHAVASKTAHAFSSYFPNYNRTFDCSLTVTIAGPVDQCWPPYIVTEEFRVSPIISKPLRKVLTREFEPVRTDHMAWLAPLAESLNVRHESQVATYTLGAGIVVLFVVVFVIKFAFGFGNVVLMSVAQHQ